MEVTKQYAYDLDKLDPLHVFRKEYFFYDPDLIYVDGNSLGRLPNSTIPVVNDILYHQWGENLIRSWGSHWYDAPTRIGDKIAKLIGASAGEVAISDSTTLNLYKLASSALMMNMPRNKVITDDLNFPSDLYTLQGINYFLGNRLSIVQEKAKNGVSIPTDQIVAQIDSNTSLVTLSHVVFKSGYKYDVKTITDAAHANGALVLWDLSHSVGSTEILLNEWNVDFAIGCTYKYLNGGPGAPAFLYVRKDLQDQALSPIWGWFGHENPFSFDLQYRPATNIRRFLAGTPPVLSVMAMESGIDLMLTAGIPNLVEKSKNLSGYLLDLVDARLKKFGFSVGSPFDAEWRGSHISLKHPEGYRINRSLIEDYNVIPDFREPDNLRLGLTPIYTSFVDVWECVDRLTNVMSGKTYEKFPVDRLTVT